ncbi:hypothetical protein RRG08_024749 [Elysia crispata]|uniref:Uncharacterized protein n=1 Tax=Elysia crispata TaxID=231223 RepID=A0AAE0YEF0_9GAST|nr:hypothetical protein RRG08_024749 [Elysia crispata]
MDRHNVPKEEEKCMCQYCKYDKQCPSCDLPLTSGNNPSLISLAEAIVGSAPLMLHSADNGQLTDGLMLLHHLAVNLRHPGPPPVGATETLASTCTSPAPISPGIFSVSTGHAGTKQEELQHQ